jgi:hypothetical protein
LLFQAASSERVREDPNCAAWVKPETNAPELDNRAWLIGFLSGANMAFSLNADHKHFNYFGGITTGQIYLWIDNYCRTNPLSSAMYSVGELVQERNKK